ncbi:hypothetical protein N9B94_04810 [Verrucomicrobia bacterium]|nr:hypothetical protein [Verrucomicrobiota bacterium]
MISSRIRFIVGACAAVAAGAGTLVAGAPELKPVVAGTPRLLFSEDFSNDTLSKKWQAVKGTWKVDEGKLAGKELAADKHAAVLNLNIPNQDLIVEFDFEAKKGSWMALSFNKKRGHLWRMTANEKGFSLVKDKDKNDPKSKSLVMASATSPLKYGYTYRLQVEFKGDKIVIRSKDGSFSLSASHSDFNQLKPNIRFVMRGDSLKMDNLKVWALK